MGGDEERVSALRMYVFGPWSECHCGLTLATDVAYSFPTRDVAAYAYEPVPENHGRRGEDCSGQGWAASALSG